MAITVCCWNIEWFDKLFDAQNGLRSDAKSKPRLAAIAEVMEAVDADLLGIVEAPNTSRGDRDTVACLEAFAAHFGLRTNKAMTGFLSRGKQEIAALFDPARIELAHNPGGGRKGNPRFDSTFEFDTDDDRIREVYRFYRPPLELSVDVIGSNLSFEMIVAHTKSKGIFSATDLVHWNLENARNRRKLFAECSWIRRRVEERLDAGREVLVVGDINDGPGMDSSEAMFGKSAVEIILGDLFDPKRILVSHIGKPKWTSKGWQPASTRFRDQFTGKQVNVLIDHALASQGLPVVPGSHVVWNPAQHAPAGALRKPLKEASDHYPVVLEISE